jgi:hypothetical protein
MNIEEIFVLNRALDGMDIFGLPSLKNVGGSEILINSVKKQLIDRGALESESSFTMDGVQLVKYIDDYKKARKYVKIDSVLIGIKDENTAVLILRKNIPIEYEFQKLNLKDFFNQLCEFYPFLIQKRKNTVEVIHQEIGYEEMKEAYAVNADNSLYLSTYTIDKNKFTDEVFFSVDGILFLYNRKSKILTTPFYDAEKLIHERIA